MWGTVLVMTALATAPAKPGALELTNVRNTYGELGGTRPDGRFLPGDVLFVGFDIEGITVSSAGEVKYRMAMEVLDGNSKPIFSQDPKDKVDFVPLGGSKLPARAFITLGMDQPPGNYTLKLTVTDVESKQSKTLSKPFEVAKADFGLVAVFTSVDERGGIPAPTTGVVGQSVFVQFAVVGFDRKPVPEDPKAKKDPKAAVPPPQPDVTIEMQPVDERGKPTLDKPMQYQLNSGVDAKEKGFAIRFLLPLTRAGKYTVKLKATDNLTKKVATFDLPMAVLPPAN
jgi:hypothetical protein